MRQASMFILLLAALILAACGPAYGIYGDYGAEATMTAAFLARSHTPTPRPTPDLAAIAGAAAPALSGEPMQDAAAYHADDPLSHRIVILDSSGALHLWNSSLPGFWKPFSVSDVDLILVAEEREIDEGTQAYIGGPPITRYRYESDLLLIEASTGEVLLEVTLRGSDAPDFPAQAAVDVTRIAGTRVSWSEIIQLLADEIGCGLCPSLELTLTGHTEIVGSVAFSPDGRYLVSGSHDDSLRLWDVADGVLLRIMEGHTRAVTSIAYSPDGQTLASGSIDYTIRMWSATDGALLRTVEWGSPHVVDSIAISPDGTILAAGSRSEQGVVGLWQVSDGTSLGTLTDHTDSVTDVAFSPDGTLLAAGSADGTVRIWTVAESELRLTIEAHAAPITGLVFSPDGAMLATGSRDLSARLWRASDGAHLYTYVGHGTSPGHADAVQVTFSPDGVTLATGAPDGVVHLWRVSDGALMLSLDGPSHGALALAFSPDGRMLAVSGSRDGAIHLWRFQ